MTAANPTGNTEPPLLVFIFNVLLPPPQVTGGGWGG